jgi:hypothetical protein
VNFANRQAVGRASFWLRLTLIGVLFAASQGTNAQSADKFYYWITPGSLRAGGESFVIEVDRARAAEIEAIRANRGLPGFSGQIASGSVDYNRDYFTPDHHLWNWHVVLVDDIFDFNNTVFPACQCPYLIANPSDIAANPDEWIRQNGNRYTPKYYHITEQIDPNKRDAMANVSNRGLTGSGEKTLITGLIVTGGVPRNVVVRAMGPSLITSGIQQVAGNPKIVVYQGSQRTATNADWKADSRASELSQKYPSLAPTNDKEAAMLLTLLPGAYTLQGINEDGTEGIVLLEAYDVDSATVP